MDKKKAVELLNKAIESRDGAYAPYSNFYVGAALLCSDGSVFLGANTENAAYSPTICAERSAFAAAITAGKRSFSAIAIAAGGENVPTPCGVCRQVMAEFCSAEFSIFCVNDSAVFEYTLGELLPGAFKLN